MTKPAISKYISYDEATKSPTAVRMGIRNDPNETQLKAMQYVATKIFDQVREHVGGPLHASSFFRSKALNAAIPGSSPTSRHMDGEAIDIDADTFGVGDNFEIFQYILQNFEFDQLIIEYPDRTGKPSWVHVGVSETKHNRREVLVKLKTRYIRYVDWKKGMI